METNNVIPENTTEDIPTPPASDAYERRDSLVLAMQSNHYIKNSDELIEQANKIYNYLKPDKK